MNLQTKASFKKEYLAFFRTKKAIILALVLIGLAVINPLFITGMSSFMSSFSDMYAELGMDVSGMTEALSSSVSTGVSTAISGITQTGLIVFLIVINTNAGGEQKKRSIIIPRSTGLRSFSYIFPKFIIYPLAAFVIAIIAIFAAWGVSTMVFNQSDVSAAGVLLASVLTGVSLMLYICAHLTIGTATGKTGMSATVCIVSSFLLPIFLSSLGAGLVYNPFTMNVLAGSVVFDSGVSASQIVEVIATAIIALVLMVVLFLIALFAQNAKRIDNSGNEVRI